MSFLDLTDLQDNIINQLATIKNNLVNDCLYYQQKENANALVLDIKQKQIKNIDNTINSIIDAFNSVHNEISRLNQLVENQDQEFFKREACAFYYGCSLYEIKSYISRPFNVIDAEIDEIIRLKVRQTPFYLLDFLDKEKQKAAWDKVEIQINSAGQI